MVGMGHHARLANRWPRTVLWPPWSARLGQPRCRLCKLGRGAKTILKDIFSSHLYWVTCSGIYDIYIYIYIVLYSYIYIDWEARNQLYPKPIGLQLAHAMFFSMRMLSGCRTFHVCMVSLEYWVVLFKLGKPTNPPWLSVYLRDFPKQGRILLCPKIQSVIIIFPHSTHLSCSGTHHVPLKIATVQLGFPHHFGRNPFLDGEGHTLFSPQCWSSASSGPTSNCSWWCRGPHCLEDLLQQVAQPFFTCCGKKNVFLREKNKTCF